MSDPKTSTGPGALRGLLRRLPAAQRAYKTLSIARLAGADLFAWRLFLTVRPHAMATNARLRNIYDIASDVERRGLLGALVEYGVRRGGCPAVMAAVAKRVRSGRRLWLFDSCEGLSEPTAEDGSAAAAYASGRTGGALRSIKACVAPLEDVQGDHRQAECRSSADRSAQKDRFRTRSPTRFGISAPLRCSASTAIGMGPHAICVGNPYDDVVPGGYVVVADYDYWGGCRRAVDEFLASRQLPLVLEPIWGNGFPDGRYLVKPVGFEMIAITE